ncbi:MAG TPA: 3-keto-5-aminohexanoate cleavage protein [Gemmatimonadales bacterium]
MRGEGAARLFLQAALNGARTRAEHPRVPLTAAELADAAEEAMEAGADAVHLHVRSANGAESLEPDDVAAVLDAVRRRCPRAPVGVSTGIWIVPDSHRRIDLVRRWPILPDFASVNFDEPGAVELAQVLLARGVGIEAGLAGATAARTLRDSGLLDSILRILLEPAEKTVAEALRTVAEIETLLPAPPAAPPRLLHGTGPTAWPLLAEAARRQYAARIGLEDTLEVADATPAADNGELVREARRVKSEG